MNQPLASAPAKTAGWDGRSLRQMLADSEAAFAVTGRCFGVERLELKESDPIRFEKLFSRLRGSLVNARETSLNISASPIVKELGELCFALYGPEGDFITLSTGILVHVHTMSEAITAVVLAPPVPAFAVVDDVDDADGTFNFCPGVIRLSAVMPLASSSDCSGTPSFSAMPTK